MSWSTPPTWVTGDWVTAGALNACLKENEEYLYGSGSNGMVDFGMKGLTYVAYETWLTYGTVVWDPTGFIADYIAASPLPLLGVVPIPDGYCLIAARCPIPPAGIDTRLLSVESTDGSTVGGPILGSGSRQSRSDSSMIVAGIVRSATVAGDSASAKVTVKAAFGGDPMNANHDFQCHQIRGL